VRYDQQLAARLVRAAVRAGGGAPARLTLARLLATADADEALALLDEITEAEAGPQAWTAVLATRALALTLGSGRPGDVLAELGDVTGAPPPVRLAAATAHLFAGTVGQAAALSDALADELTAIPAGPGGTGAGPATALLVSLCQTAALAISGELDRAIAIGTGSLAMAGLRVRALAPVSLMEAGPAGTPGPGTAGSAGRDRGTGGSVTAGTAAPGRPSRSGLLAVPAPAAAGSADHQAAPLRLAGTGTEPATSAPATSTSVTSRSARSAPITSAPAVSLPIPPAPSAPAPVSAALRAIGPTARGPAIHSAPPGRARAPVTAGQAAPGPDQDDELPEIAAGDTGPEFWGVAAGLLLALEQRGEPDRLTRLGTGLLELAVARADVAGRARMVQSLGRAELIRGRPPPRGRCVRSSRCCAGPTTPSWPGTTACWRRRRPPRASARRRPAAWPGWTARRGSSRCTCPSRSCAAPWSARRRATTRRPRGGAGQRGAGGRAGARAGGAAGPALHGQVR
jgi:hypothetical protein